MSRPTISTTGHKDPRMTDGQSLVEHITQTVTDECNFYGVEPPTPKQMAIVISAIRMHSIIMQASTYDTSELGHPNEVTKYWPIESSIGRYFRDAARVTLDEEGKSS